MRTDQLIATLASDDTMPKPIAGRVMWSVGAALLLGLSITIAIAGLRSDLSSAMTNPVTLMKWVLPIAVGLPALTAALLLTRPQTQQVPVTRVILVVAGGAAVWLTLSIMHTPAGGVGTAVRGTSAMTCLGAVVLISTLPLTAMLWWLRDGASPSPMISGACAGAAAGGFAAAIYALGCTEDAPQFFLIWYSIAILISTGIGALAGRRYLRW